jgi:hypothetical protein
MPIEQTLCQRAAALLIQWVRLIGMPTNEAMRPRAVHGQKDVLQIGAGERFMSGWKIHRIKAMTCAIPHVDKTQADRLLATYCVENTSRGCKFCVDFDSRPLGIAATQRSSIR